MSDSVGFRYPVEKRWVSVRWTCAVRHRVDIPGQGNDNDRECLSSELSGYTQTNHPEVTKLGAYLTLHGMARIENTTPRGLGGHRIEGIRLAGQLYV